MMLCESKVQFVRFTQFSCSCIECAEVIALNTWTWKQVLKQDGEPVLLLSIRRPDFPEERRATRRLQRYYRRLVDTWKARWEQALFPLACQALSQAREQSRPFQPWTASLDYAVTLEDEDRLSLRLEVLEQCPTQRPARVWCGDTWNKHTGTPVLLRGLLPVGTTRRDLTDLLAQQAAQRLAGGESMLYEDVEYRAKVSFSPERFFLTQEGLVIFYPMLALGPAAEGVPAFPLDLSAIPQKKKSKKRN